MTFSRLPLAVGALVGLAAAAPARAELVHLTSGRVISASSVVLAEETATIRLRGGGGSEGLRIGGENCHEKRNCHHAKNSELNPVPRDLASPERTIRRLGNDRKTPLPDPRGLAAPRVNQIRMANAKVPGLRRHSPAAA